MNYKHYKSISDVSELLKIKKHVIRYWDSRFEGVSTRLGEKKRRYFSPENIRKLQTLKNLLHTNDKSHHSLEMARKILENNINKNKTDLLKDKSFRKIDTDKLTKISLSLKKLVKSI